MKFDFGGHATKYNVKCSDGRTIKANAFEHMDGETVPLVWQHQHDSPANVLGHAMLENTDKGVYAKAVFNDSEAAVNAKKLVQHGDVKGLSVYANGLVEKSKNVIHGNIKEVSLVLAGANPEAYIDNVVIEHSDGSKTKASEEAVAYFTTDIKLGGDDVQHADGDGDQTVKDVFDTFNKEQKDVVYALIADAMGEDNNDDDNDDDDGGDNIKQSDIGGKQMKKNVFDKTQDKDDSVALLHSNVGEVLGDAQNMGSLESAVLKHAGTYGIDNIDVLFPDAQNIKNKPDWIKRDTGWVSKWMGATRHTPFSRIKSMYSDITPDEARAKGYVKENEKADEVFAAFKRITEPQTVYKKQKLDRDDVIDITGFDVVAWLKAEMRLMLNEEIARASLVGDGRSVASDDKIKEDKIRPIYGDDEIYAPVETLEASVTHQEEIEKCIRARKNYKGTGRPNLYLSADKLADWLLVKDNDGRRIYKTEAELKATLRVKEIYEVEVMEGVSRNDGTDDIDLVAIFVNPRDYTFGSDKGGKVSMFDNFDIDFNQMKYLIETRTSGCLTTPKSALVIEKIRAAG